MSIISNNIKYLRRLNGLTQEQFSRRIGIKRSLLGAYEEARANPNYDNLLMIAKVFGVSIDQLLKQDLRRVRDTPDLIQQAPILNPVVEPPAAPPSPAPPPDEPKVLANLVEKYFREEPPIRHVSQKITPKPIEYRSHKVASPRQPTGSEKTIVQSSLNHPRFSTVSYVPLVRQSEYILKCKQPEYLQSLEYFSVPKLPDGSYRAFEISDDFVSPGSILIGSFVRNWYELQDGTQHLVVLKKGNILFRTVYNQLTAKGILILGSDIPRIPTQEVVLQDIAEIWEVKAFLSFQLPQPTVPLPRIKHLVNELKEELDKIKS